jgi:hypothetical protein
MPGHKYFWAHLLKTSGFTLHIDTIRAIDAIERESLKKFGKTIPLKRLGKLFQLE